jgi:uncharacterized protein
MIARLAMRHALAALVVLAMIGVARPATPETPAPSPASMLLAKQIVEAKGVMGIFEPVVREEVEKVRSALIQTNLNWMKDINDSAGIVYRSYGARAGEFADAVARIYATHFTEAELKDLLAFYQSPLGRKMLTEEPKALNEVATYSRQWGQSISDDVMTKMRAEMKKRGHEL